MSHYTRPIFIPFHLGDPAGIVFFGHLFSLAHDIYEHFVQDRLHITWVDWFNNSEWIVPIKQTSASYHQPLFAGQTYEVELILKKITNCSVTFEFRFKKEQIEHCCVETLHVFCSRVSKTKQPIPQAISEKFREFEYLK